MSREKKREKPLLSTLSEPCFEFTGNREVVIEGSRGVLGYSPENIRVNTAALTLSLFGRGLNLRCISDSALVIEGVITSVEFHT